MGPKLPAEGRLRLLVCCVAGPCRVLLRVPRAARCARFPSALYAGRYAHRSFALLRVYFKALLLPGGGHRNFADRTVGYDRQHAWSSVLLRLRPYISRLRFADGWLFRSLAPRTR